MNNKKIILARIFIALILILFFLYSIINYWMFKEGYVQTARFNYLIIFLIIFSMEAIPQIISPYLIAASFLIIEENIILLLFFISTASFFGSITGYYSGHHFSKKFIEIFASKETLKKSKKIKDLLKKYGKYALLIIALSPLPYFPLIFGSLKTPKKEFIFFGAIPRAIGYFLYAFALFFIF